MSDTMQDKINVMLNDFIKNNVLPPICEWLEREKKVIVDVDELYSVLNKDTSKIQPKGRKGGNKRKNVHTIFDVIEKNVTDNDEGKIEVDKFEDFFREKQNGFLIKELEDSTLISYCIITEDGKKRQINNKEKLIADKKDIKIVSEEEFLKY
jgi:hypothetical protein